MMVSQSQDGGRGMTNTLLIIVPEKEIHLRRVGSTTLTRGLEKQDTTLPFTQLYGPACERQQRSVALHS